MEDDRPRDRPGLAQLCSTLGAAGREGGREVRGGGWGGRGFGARLLMFRAEISPRPSSSSMYLIPSRKELSPLHKGRNGISRNLLLYFFLFSISAASPNRPYKKVGASFPSFFLGTFLPLSSFRFPPPTIPCHTPC